VITDSVLIDTGPLVALLNPHDQYHQICIDQAKAIAGEVFTSWAVVTEAAWLLRNMPNSIGRLLQAINDRNIHCLHLDSPALPWLSNAAKQYADLSPQIADLSLLYLANQQRLSHVFTLDRRDFAVFRQSSGKALKLLPATL
jgi:predicted nucleic acid-binding protein